MSYFVYILKSLKDGRCYTGMTNDLVWRLKEHNQGKMSTPFTLSRGPFRLIHAEECVDRVEARKREKFWKSGEGRELRDKIFG